MYLDHAATTPMRQVAIDAMVPLLADGYANPSGAYRFARQARRAVDDARDHIAAVVGCLPGEVVFTSGGTESDNAAIAGAVWRHGGVPVCAASEHHGVLNVVERHDGRVVGADRYGRTDLDELATAMGDDVAIVSVMAVNNEVGSINDLAAAADIVRRSAPSALLHTDAVQAACWLDLRQLWPHVDLMSLSAHKFGGPKGVGALIVRKGVTIDPLLVGGGQERDRRSGTHNVPGIVAMAAALGATDVERLDECARIAVLRDRLIGGLLDTVADVRETVPVDVKVAGGAHVCVDGIESESLLFLLDEEGLCASAASACASGAMEPSHVLAAMGVEPRWAGGALRMTLGRTTTEADVERAIDILAAAITKLRARAPEAVR